VGRRPRAAGRVEVKTVLTAQKCRRHSAECQRLAEQTGNARVKGILLDMARTWTRLALEAERWNQENSPRAFEHRNGISLNTAGRWLRGLDRLRYLSGRSRAATRVFCSHRFTAEPVGRGAREAGKRRKFERGLINNFALLLRQLLRLSVERASVSAFLSQHVAGYVLKSLSCWATRATSRCSLNTLLLRLLRFE
jgi:hypothetical protein